MQTIVFTRLGITWFFLSEVP